jgi:hypothetical protein
VRPDEPGAGYPDRRSTVSAAGAPSLHSSTAGQRQGWRYGVSGPGAAAGARPRAADPADRGDVPHSAGDCAVPSQLPGVGGCAVRRPTADTAHKKARLHVHRLRRALGDSERIRFEGSGYALRVHPDELDAERFETLLHAPRGRRRLRLRRACPCGAAVAQGPRALARRPVRRCRQRAAAARRGRPADRVPLAGLEELYAAELACGHARRSCQNWPNWPHVTRCGNGCRAC